MRTYATLLALTLPLLTRANGGPVEWTGPTGTGDLAPVERADVTLVSEKLRIVLDEDGKRFHAFADYALFNAGSAATVKFGVPLFWYEAELQLDELARLPADARAGRLRPTAAGYPQKVRIRLGGSAFPCRLEDLRAEAETEAVEVRAWCVADLVIPPGAHQLTLEYPGQLRFVEHGGGPRSLLYELAPAGHWAGRPEALDVEIETRSWAELFRPEHPAGFVEDGTRRLLRVRNPDLKALGAIRGTLDAAPVLRHRAIAGMERDPRFTATASSELAPERGTSYGAANVLDGAPATAWCVRTPKRGVGESIVLRADDVEITKRCGLGGYSLVPGYAKTQASWTKNNRVKRVRIAACDDEEGEVRSWRVARRHDTSAISLAPVRADPLVGGSATLQVALDAVEEARAGGSAVVRAAPEDLAVHVRNYCLRVTILEVEGEAADTCVSELRPDVSCVEE
jgi:hypothetical protein